MEDQCIGKDKFVTNESYNWYVPNGKVPAEVTYCEWCYNNGCFNPDAVYKIEPYKMRANCDCPYEHYTLSKKIEMATKLFRDSSLKCPECYFRRSMSSGFPLSHASEGHCSHCGGYIHSCSYKLCVSCCVIENKCFECNQPFTSGNEYFSQFWDKFDPDKTSCIADDTSGRLLFVLHRLKGLSNKQVMDAVIEGSLYKQPISKEEKRKQQDNETSRKFMKAILKYDDAKIEDEIIKHNAMTDKIKQEIADEELDKKLKEREARSKEQKKPSKDHKSNDNNNIPSAAAAPVQQQPQGFMQKVKEWII